jgi:uncharacterized RDD family membrane protein YckC
MCGMSCRMSLGQSTRDAMRETGVLKNELECAGLGERFLALLVDVLRFCACFFPITRIVKGVWLMSPNDHNWVGGGASLTHCASLSWCTWGSTVHACPFWGHRC